MVPYKNPTTGGRPSVKGCRLIYFNMEDNLLYAISMLQYDQLHVVIEIS